MQDVVLVVMVWMVDGRVQAGQPHVGMFGGAVLMTSLKTSLEPAV